MADRPALFMQEPETHSMLTVRTDLPGGELTISLQAGVVAVTMPLRRNDVQVLIETLDDWLFDSRPS